MVGHVGSLNQTLGRKKYGPQGTANFGWALPLNLNVLILVALLTLLEFSIENYVPFPLGIP